MDIKYFISSLENSAKKIKSLLEGVSEEQVKWKPQPEKWSILEVVNHLYDEERDDLQAGYLNIIAEPFSTKYASP
jgi:hypothetical protein